jgi:SAM-dependent methyltransferase
MISKKSITRQRLRPMIWDPHFISTKNNLRTVKKLSSMINKQSIVLDIGCGFNPFKEIIPHKKYTGIDFDKKASDADIALDCNIRKLPFQKDHFDVVIISETLEHLLEIEHVLSEVRRVLKRNGLLFISTPFMFCEHGVPHDYYRFTRYYYNNKFHDFIKLHVKTSNNFLSTPFVVCNQLLEHLPISILRLPFIMLNNIIILLLELAGKIFLAIIPDKKIADGLERGYEDISLIMRKK